MVNTLKTSKDFLEVISKGQKYTKRNNLKNGIDHSKQYSFEEYVDLLSKTNISKEYPDINNVPE